MEVRSVHTPQDVERAYPCATENPVPFWADGLPGCRGWLAAHLGRYVEGLHLLDESGNVIGHIYWAPSDQALVPYEIEDGAAYIYCEWVQHGYRGRGGMRLLFQEFVRLLCLQGYKGMLVDGTEFEGYMHYQHFIKRGFQVLREGEGGKLLYYPLSQPSIAVKPLTLRVAKETDAKVEVLVIGSRFCPVGASAVLAVRRVAQEFGERVAVREIPASREVVARYGVADGIFINGKPRFFGPVKEDQVRKAIENEMKA